MTCGKSSLILDAWLVQGNPVDSSQLKPMIQRHCEYYGDCLRQASFDGGFASHDDLKWAKKKGIEDVTLAKKGKLKVSDMARSKWVYRQLRRLRAGIEGYISMFKRGFGGDRCTWKSWEHSQ